MARRTSDIGEYSHRPLVPVLHSGGAPYNTAQYVGQNFQGPAPLSAPLTQRVLEHRSYQHAGIPAPCIHPRPWSYQQPRIPPLSGQPPLGPLNCQHAGIPPHFAQSTLGPLTCHPAGIPPYFVQPSFGPVNCQHAEQTIYYPVQGPRLSAKVGNYDRGRGQMESGRGNMSNHRMECSSQSHPVQKKKAWRNSSHTAQAVISEETKRIQSSAKRKQLTQASGQARQLTSRVQQAEVAQTNSKDLQLKLALDKQETVSKANKKEIQLAKACVEATQLSQASNEETQITQADAKQTHPTPATFEDAEPTLSSSAACNSNKQKHSAEVKKTVRNGACAEKAATNASALSKSFWKQLYTEEMLQDIKKRFPDLLGRTYCIPNELYYKLKFRSSRDPSGPLGEPLEVETGADSDTRSSRSEVLVRQCLSRLAACLQDPMIILFGYDFNNFLNKSLQTNSPQYVSTSVPPPQLQCPFQRAREFFPSPQNCPSLASRKSQAKVPAGTAPQSTGGSKLVRGDFDVLIISRKYGFVVMEIKSVGDCSVIPNSSDQVRTVTDEEIREKVKKAVQDQLPKSEKVIRHLFSDLSKTVRVIKILAVPCLNRSQLKTAVEGDAVLREQFCSCLTDWPKGSQRREEVVKQLEEGLKHCLCEGEIGSYGDQCEMEAVLVDESSAQDERLKSWWEDLTNRRTLNESQFPDVASNAITDDSYVQIISRFCGMYSTLAVDNRKGQRDEVRTVDECIHLTGVRFGRNILFPAQKSILDRDDRFLCLTGAPGSGKTLILGLKAAEWAKAGHQVIFVCVEGVQYGTLVSLALTKQVTEMVQRHTGKVHVERVSLETSVESVVNILLNKHKEGFKVIIDEIPKEISRDLQSTMLKGCITHLEAALTLFQNLQPSLKDHSGDLCPEPIEVSTAHSLDIFKEIESNFSYLAARMKSFKVAESGYFLPVLDEDWTKSLLDIQKLYDKGKSLHQSLYPLRKELDKTKGLLLDIHVHLQAALGSLYNLYTSLYFLIIHKLMEVLAKKHEEDNEDVSVWTSSMYHFHTPRVYENATFDLCVRCPPTIQTLLELLDKDLPAEMQSMTTYINVLSVHTPPLPSTGQKIKLLDHSDHVTQVTEVSDCPECGQALVTYLVDTLHISKDSKGPLKPQDVVISGSPVEGNDDCAFLQELRQKFDIKLQSREEDKPPPYENFIFVTGGSILQGLESKIVVYVPKVKFTLGRLEEGTANKGQRPDLPCWLQSFGTWNRRQLWFVASRTLSHLIVFVCTRPRQQREDL